MPNELPALAIEPATAPGEADYKAVCAAISESARGRAFLAEHARRSRKADTETLLAAIERIEARLHADASAVQRLRDDLRALLTGIRFVRPEINAASPAVQATKLGKLLDLLERRIDAMAAKNPVDAGDTAEEMSGSRLAPVPRPDEPELPIPAPAGVATAPIALVGNAAPTAEVTAANSGAAAGAGDEQAVKTPAKPASPPADPLAAIMALSEEERLALFT